jgi:hypothetical protein
MFAGTLAGERWLAVQADRAATQKTAAAATALTARMLIRRTTARPGCAVVWYGALALSEAGQT